ncbi:MAG: hypothetical protein B7Z35_05905 [Hydrogenophilales bacterium 12-61-10]|nr:MAG: hypothetical protein B7Z35_05905 [Hydrogenophilales bacterium 12-61-10]OYX30642.1 MAG: hypothetical protein B7Z03_05650 [Hydrogenophilales bacterium 32-62-9]
MWGRIAKFALSVPFLIAAALFAFYLVLGFFLVNPLAQKILPWLGETRFASQLSVQQVTFNPLTLEATISGLKLAEQNGAPLAGFERLYINIDTTGMFRWAWRIQAIQLDKPRATVLVRPGGRLNWQGLLDKLKEDREPPSDTIPRVLIDHIRIADGDIDYTDANRAGLPFKVALAPLGIELNGLSTLAEDRGDYLVAAKLPEQGGTLKWKGDVGLNPLVSSGQVGLEGVRLGNLLRVVKSPRNFELPSGVLAAGLTYRFAMVRSPTGNDQPSLRVTDANLRVSDLAVAPKGGGAPVLQLREARISKASLDLLQRTVDVASVRLSGAQLAATRNAAGVLDWQTLFAPAGAPAQSTAQPVSIAADPTAAAASWKLALREITLAEWTARLTDQTFVQPLTAEVSRFDLSAAVAGEVGAKTALTVGPVKASLGALELRSGAAPVATLARVELNNARLALADRRVDIDALTLSGMTTQVARQKDGTLNWARILQKVPGSAAAVAAESKTPAAQPLQIALARFALEDINVGFSDQTPLTPVTLDLVEGFVKAGDLNLDLTRPVLLEAGFSIRQGGRFDAGGTLAPAPLTGDLKLKLAGLSLKPFAPYLNSIVRLNLNRGTAGASGKLKLASRTGQPLSLAFDGGFSVDKLDITEEESGASFLGWERLASRDLKVGLAPSRVHMGMLRATAPFAKILIHEDGRPNIQKLMRSQLAGTSSSAAAAQAKQEATAETGQDEAAPASAPPPAKAREPVRADVAPPAFPFEIEQVRIDNGKLDFADLSLTPQFGALMHALSGVINGVSNDPAAVAQLELDGKVDAFGSARIRGTVQPFRATEFTDITLTFRNLQMASLTPYSGKFAGRRIESGTLSVDLEYKVKARQLAGENKFVINKLKLGERIESPSAKNLPLDLAIALLEDSNGIIDLDLPVSGNLDDPQFSYGRIIWKAIVNVLTKLVTAPFRALGKLLGVNADKLDGVSFDPGSSMLAPPEQEKLKTLAEAMTKRPALALKVEPGYDPEADRRALQEQAIRREVIGVLGVKLAPNEAPGPVDVNNHTVQTWLEKSYGERVGKAEYATLRARYKAQGGGNAITDSAVVERLGRLFSARDNGPASPLHTELLDQLTQKIVIDDAALIRLAQARAQVMHDSLVQHGLDGARISLAAPASLAAKDHQVGSKLLLGTRGVAAPGAGEPAQSAVPQSQPVQPAQVK